MEDISLPPFYVGQKVVALTTCKDNFRIKGKIYVVKELIQRTCCNSWLIDIGDIFPYKHNGKCGSCGALNKKENNNIYWHLSTRFAPIQEQEFKQTTYSKVLEEVICCDN